MSTRRYCGALACKAKRVIYSKTLVLKGHGIKQLIDPEDNVVLLYILITLSLVSETRETIWKYIYT